MTMTTAYIICPQTRELVSAGRTDLDPVSMLTEILSGAILPEMTLAGCPKCGESHPYTIRDVGLGDD
jgi:hypothetical protein